MFLPPLVKPSWPVRISRVETTGSSIAAQPIHLNRTELQYQLQPTDKSSAVFLKGAAMFFRLNVQPQCRLN